MSHGNRSRRGRSGTAAWPLWGLLVTSILGIADPALVAPKAQTRSDLAAVLASGAREITAGRIRAHMVVLADDSMEGRETGTPGFDRAAAYVADQFRDQGLRDIAGSYLQPMTIRRTRVDEDQSTLEITRSGVPEALVYGRDFVTYGMRGPDILSVSGQVVVIGDGVVVPGTDVDAYATVDAVGKMALVLPGAPASLSSSQKSYYGSADVKAAIAAAHGVTALLLIDEMQIPWDLRVAATRQLGVNETLPATRSPAVPVIYLNRSTAERIMGRPLIGAAPLVGSTIASARLAVRQVSRDVRSANVHALWPGADPTRAREHVLVVAHLDHVGVGIPLDGDAIYNGAVDNASGVAAVLAIARAFTRLPDRPARSVIFLATTGEEQGLIGADYFVRHAPVPIDSIVAAVNVDGTSVVPFDRLDIRGGSNSSLGTLADVAARQMGLTAVHESVGVGGSDHSPFLLAGIPPLWIGATLTDDWMRTRYHTPRDDMNQPLDLVAAARYAQFVFLTAHLAADATARPVWSPGEFFGTRRLAH